MDKQDNQKEIDKLKRELEALKREVNKNQFSNLYVFDEQVQFKTNTIYPKDNTAIATSTVNSTGRIAIKDSEGTTRYIPYF